MSLRPSLHPFSFMPRVKNNNNMWFCVLQNCAIKYLTAVNKTKKDNNNNKNHHHKNDKNGVRPNLRRYIMNVLHLL